MFTIFPKNFPLSFIQTKNYIKMTEKMPPTHQNSQKSMIQKKLFDLNFYDPAVYVQKYNQNFLNTRNIFRINRELM